MYRLGVSGANGEPGSQYFMTIERSNDYGKTWTLGCVSPYSEPVTIGSPRFDPYTFVTRAYFEELNHIKCTLKKKTSDADPMDLSKHQVIGYHYTTLGAIVTTSKGALQWKTLVDADNNPTDIEISLQWAAPIPMADCRDVVHEIRAAEVPKAGFFSEKPESYYTITHKGQTVYPSPIQWDNNNPDFPFAVTTLAELTRDDPNAVFEYNLWNYDEKSKKSDLIGTTKDLTPQSLTDKRSTEVPLYNAKGSKVKTTLKVKTIMQPRSSLLEGYFGRKGSEFAYSISFDFSERHSDAMASRVQEALKRIVGHLTQWSSFQLV